MPKKTRKRKFLIVVLVLVFALYFYPGYSEDYRETPDGLSSFVALKMRLNYQTKINPQYLWYSRLSNICVEKYFGNYSGCKVVYMHVGSFGHTDAERPVMIAGYEVVFCDGREVWVYKNGKFYTLVEAYEKGKITKGDVYEIGKKVGVEFELNYPEPLED